VRAPLLVIVTDLHTHRFWLSPEADAYVCDTPAGAREACERGIAPERVHPLGIPTAREFHVPFDLQRLRQEFGLHPQRHVVLITSGGRPVGPFEQVVRGLIDLELVVPNQLQLMVVCGEDARMARRLTRLAERSAMPVRVFGFIETMPQAMAVSDLVVAKAGGLTVSEALARGRPLVLYHAIPGQERWNAQYLAEHGAAVTAFHPSEVAAAVRRFLEHPETFEAVRRAAASLSRADAAEAIVSQVVIPLLGEKV
jgi:processive 1,2-diacylglycerol beta-glucosyltransferase